MDTFFPLLRAAFFEGVKRVSPAESVSSFLKKKDGRLFVRRDRVWTDISPGRGGRLFIIATGKAAPGMYRGAAGVVKMRHEGIVATGEYEGHIPGVTLFRCGHPFPDDRSREAAKAILRAVNTIRTKDTLLYLLSGGSSSMVSLPVDDVPFADKVDTVKVVMKGGASIEELNSVRSAISQVKGGKIADAVGTERVCVLVVSDVPGNDLSVIGSGPLYHSPLIVSPRKVLEKLSLTDAIPPSVRKFLHEKAGNETSHRTMSVPHAIVADNQRALAGTKEFLASRGYEIVTGSEQFAGEAFKTGVTIGRTILQLKETTGADKQAFLAGGETVVTVKGSGSGGRNQEMAIGAALSIEGVAGIAGLCGSTDGVDGNSPAAGGFFDGYLLGRAKNMKMNHHIYLKNNDSYRFFKETGYEFITGPSGTNVMDLLICLIHR